MVTLPKGVVLKGRKMSPVTAKGRLVVRVVTKDIANSRSFSLRLDEDARCSPKTIQDLVSEVYSFMKPGMKLEVRAWLNLGCTAILSKMNFENTDLTGLMVHNVLVNLENRGRAFRREKLKKHN